MSDPTNPPDSGANSSSSDSGDSAKTTLGIKRSAEGAGEGEGGTRSDSRERKPLSPRKAAQMRGRSTQGGAVEKRETHRDKQGFGDRRPREGYGDRPPRQFGDRPPRQFGDRPPREGYGDRPPRQFGDRPPRQFGDRPPREGFGDRPPRQFGDRPPREGFGDRPPRQFRDRPPREGFGDRPPRQFGDRPPREGFGDRPPRQFGDRPPREGFGDRPPRQFGDRPPREGYGDRPPRQFGDRPPRQFGDRPPRQFGDRPPREGFGDRPPRQFGDRPPREGYGDRPPRQFGDRPPREGFGDRRGGPRREGDGDRRGFGERRNFGERRDFSQRNEQSGEGLSNPGQDNDQRNLTSGEDQQATQRDTNQRGEYSGYGDRRSFSERRDEQPRRNFSDRRGFGDRVGARETRDGERRDDGARRNFSDRRGFGDRVGFNDRGDSGQRSDAGERQSYGERKSYGDRDDRRSFTRRDGSDHSARHNTYAGERKALRESRGESRDHAGDGAELTNSGIRLSKRMTELGLSSRREADEWIERGWVSVNGTVVDVLGSRVELTDQITVDPEASKQQAQWVTVLINKPVGYVSGQAEDGYEPAMVLVTPENRWEKDDLPLQWNRSQMKHLVPAGRLDIDSTGLLVLTQDGRVAKALIGEQSTIEKEYLVRVERGPDFDNEAGLELLRHGLELDDQKLLPAKVSWQNEDQLRFVLKEGKKRQIRRMCELVGLHVVGLKRIRIGQIPLSALPEGKWRYLRQTERF